MTSALDIGNVAEQYLAESSYESALEKFQSSLKVLVPMLRKECPGRRKELLTKQVLSISNGGLGRGGETNTFPLLSPVSSFIFSYHLFLFSNLHVCPFFWAPTFFAAQLDGFACVFLHLRVCAQRIAGVGMHILWIIFYCIFLYRNGALS
jgi:hypothetical protein